MLISSGELPKNHQDYVFEQKVDGVRAIIMSAGDSFAIYSRHGNDLSQRFPEIRSEIRRMARRVQGQFFVLDAELCTITRDGSPSRFGDIQPRISSRQELTVRQLEKECPAGLMIFDLIVRKGDALLSLPYASDGLLSKSFSRLKNARPHSTLSQCMRVWTRYLSKLKVKLGKA